MVNHFARFGFAPRPWIDPELLKERFLDLSATTHPDKASDKSSAETQFKEINEAYNVLRNSRSRLLYLLELHGLPKQEHVQNVPPEVMQFFSSVAAITQQADQLIKHKTAATSPMLKVQFMDQGLDQIDRMQELQRNLASAISAIETRLKAASESWSESPAPAILQELATSAAALGFLERWSAQLHERIAALTF